MWEKHSETVHSEYLVLVFFRYMYSIYSIFTKFYNTYFVEQISCNISKTEFITPPNFLI